MDYPRLIDDIPLWLLFVGTLAIVATSVEAGYRMGRYRLASEQDKLREQDAPVAVIVAATLGLLAFLLGFTFSLAATRFDARRLIVLEESNAIGTAYLRAGLLPEPIGAEARKLLREYVDVRLRAPHAASIDRSVAESTALHGAMWSNTKEAAERDPHSIMTGLFVQSMNEVIDLHAKRVLLALHNRVPLMVWLALYFVTAVAMATVGYLGGLANSRRSWAIVALALTFSAVIYLIGDLDRPQEGLLRVGQQSMVDLQDSLKAGP